MTPPVPVVVNPPDKSTGFSGTKITVTFNEYIQLKDLANQLVVTPFMKKQPEVSTSGKNLVVKFEEGSLAPNTTYRLYFGNAVADMNESNSLSGYEYVFSTGATIDTLRLSGTVTGAFDKKPAGSVLVGLYGNALMNDSLVYKSNPDYFARTNENGEFSLKNLPPATFRVFAFSDKNKNFHFDAGAEKVAFLSEPLNLTGDSSIRLSVFEEEIKKGFIKTISSPVYGKSHIILNRKSQVKLSAVRARDAQNIFEDRKGMEKDTVTVYYRYITDTLKLLLENVTFAKKDTLKIALPQSTRPTGKLRPFTVNASSGTLLLGQQLQIRFPTWMDTARTNLARIRLLASDTAVASPLPAGRWTDVSTFEFTTDFAAGTGWNVKIDTAAFRDVYGISNDSSKFSFKKENRLEFGKLTLKIVLRKKLPYLVELIGEQQKPVKQIPVRPSLSSSNAVTLDFTDVPPGSYHVRLISDDNGNGKWDTGDVIEKRQPEEVIIHSKEIKVIADWEVEEELRFND